MKMHNIPFGITEWSGVPAEEHSAQAGQAFWRTQQFGDVRGQSLPVVWIVSKSSLANNFWQAGDVAGDGRRSAGHRFQRRQTESFVKRRVNKSFGG